jgi:hypothetical protein
MATKMEDVVTEIGLEKFRAAVIDSVSIMVKALSIFAGKILLFILAQLTHCIL